MSDMETVRLAKELLSKGNTAEGVSEVAQRHLFCCPNLAVGLSLISEEMKKMLPFTHDSCTKRFATLQGLRIHEASCPLTVKGEVA